MKRKIKAVIKPTTVVLIYRGNPGNSKASASRRDSIPGRCAWRMWSDRSLWFSRNLGRVTSSAQQCHYCSANTQWKHKTGSTALSHSEALQRNIARCFEAFEWERIQRQ
ncbi:hypothetical protein EVAR_52563_1 [Eumeta japonica]|uniref:Uncharacterized protein n=1 Tax=Eumeta variegata TaxID=151549 RepID=A0A4C1YAP5_EUMVA|nr:hypothetical protein EVAR_52563_1 [Eumeta japonica]